MTTLVKKILAGVVFLGVAGGLAIWYLGDGNDQSALYRTVPVTKGDLLVTISATGVVQPEEVVDVGAQVAGQILEFGKDAAGKTIDYGSVVEAGTVLARIDDSVYKAELAQAQAQVKSAKANVARATADLQQLQAKSLQAERDWQRAQKLGPSEALAQAAYDGYQSNYETAQANVVVGEAVIQEAKAGLAQAEAVLRKARRNLSYCTITSPVKGVIIDRRVNIGQTVVASLNAPSLFLIAKDLKRMQVWVAVNEADIGKVQPGQAVTFTVDAFPGEIFTGEVGKIRLNASMTQNVVTYTVEILTDNTSGRLLPYLTANVSFELAHRSGILMVPNGALRWTPAPEQVASALRDDFTNPAKTGGQQGDQRRAASPKGVDAGQKTGTVWMSQGKYVRPVTVRTGLTDGSMTEVQGKDLEEGQQVITGIQIKASEDNGGGNPFTPRFRRSRDERNK